MSDSHFPSALKLTWAAASDGKETMRGAEGGFGGKPPVPLAYIRTVLPSLEQPNWVFLLRLKIYAQPQRPCWSQNKDVNK